MLFNIRALSVSGIRPVLQHLAVASCFKFRPHTWKVIWQRYSYENNYFLHVAENLLRVNRIETNKENMSNFVFFFLLFFYYFYLAHSYKELFRSCSKFHKLQESLVICLFSRKSNNNYRNYVWTFFGPYIVCSNVFSFLFY
jgi:hypothetical protein